MKKVINLLIISTVIVALFMTMFFAGCKAATVETTAAEATTASSESVDLSQKTIALAIHFMMDDWAKFFAKAFQERSDEYGLKNELLDGQGNPEKQLNDIINAHTKKVDALIVIPLDQKALTNELNKMIEEGAVVWPLTPVEGVNAPGFDGGDYEKGKLAGEEMVKALGGKGKIVILGLPSMGELMEIRMKGFNDALDGSQIEILDTKTGTSNEEFLNITTDLITSGVKVDGVFSALSTAVGGAASAFKQNGEKNMLLMGIDADYSTLNMINEGWVDGVAANPPQPSAILAVDTIVKMLKGEAVPDIVVLPNPTYWVDKNNAAQASIDQWEKELVE